MNVLQKLYRRIKSLKPPYPGLRYNIENGKEIWEGPLSLVAIFDSIRVKDTFDIRIELPTTSDGFPRVKEIGGRAEKLLSEGKVKRLIDIHINPPGSPLAGTICLCPQPDEKRRFPGRVNLKKFIRELVIPYFFAFHQFEKTKKWVWGEYGHGGAGILEYYLENRNNGDPKLLEDCMVAIKCDPKSSFKTNLQLNGKEPCACQSGKQYRKCHPKALEGFRAIIEDQDKKMKNEA